MLKNIFRHFATTFAAEKMQLHRRSRRNHKTSTKLRIFGDNFSLRSFGNVPAPLSHTIFLSRASIFFFQAVFPYHDTSKFYSIFCARACRVCLDALVLSRFQKVLRWFVFLVGVGSRRCKLIVLSIPSDRLRDRCRAFFFNY